MTMETQIEGWTVDDIGSWTVITTPPRQMVVFSSYVETNIPTKMLTHHSFERACRAVQFVVNQIAMRET